MVTPRKTSSPGLERTEFCCCVHASPSTCGGISVHLGSSEACLSCSRPDVFRIAGLMAGGGYRFCSLCLPRNSQSRCKSAEFSRLAPALLYHTVQLVRWGPWSNTSSGLTPPEVHGSSRPIFPDTYTKCLLLLQSGFSEKLQLVEVGDCSFVFGTTTCKTNIPTSTACGPRVRHSSTLLLLQDGCPGYHRGSAAGHPSCERWSWAWLGDSLE